MNAFQENGYCVTHNLFLLWLKYLKQIFFQAGIINDDIVKKMPSRGRKRFVSEGDGGLIKDSSYW